MPRTTDKRPAWNPYAPQEEARKLQEREEELARREGYSVGVKIKLEAEEEDQGIHIDTANGVDFVNRRWKVVPNPRPSTPPPPAQQQHQQRRQAQGRGRNPSSGSASRLAALASPEGHGSDSGSSPGSVGTQGTLSPGGEARIEARIRRHQQEAERLQSRLQRWGPSWGGGSQSMAEPQEGELEMEFEDFGEEEEEEEEDEAGVI